MAIVGVRLWARSKKGKYVYYHCTGYKGKCPDTLHPFEEIFEANRFAELLKRLSFDDEILGWVTEALRQSHGDEKQHHDEAISRLQAEYKRLQARIDTAYEDKLDGKIDAGFFDRKAIEWRSEQDRILQSIEEHQGANQVYLDEGIRILELSQKAYGLFKKQEPREKRRLLNFLLSNCSWKDGELTPTFRQPFNMIAETERNPSKEKGRFSIRKIAFLKTGSPSRTRTYNLVVNSHPLCRLSYRGVKFPN